MCLRWGDAVPQFLRAHPRAAGGKRSPKGQVSQREMLRSPSQASSAGAYRFLSPARRCRFVKHGPEVLMSNRGTQHLPWLHPETMPRPAPGLLHKKPAPRRGGQPSAPHGEDSSVPGARSSSGSIGSRRAGTGALSR